jgi:serine/threonine protein kinase
VKLISDVVKHNFSLHEIELWNNNNRRGEFIINDLRKDKECLKKRNVQLNYLLSAFLSRNRVQKLNFDNATNNKRMSSPISPCNCLNLNNYTLNSCLRKRNKSNKSINLNEEIFLHTNELNCCTASETNVMVPPDIHFEMFSSGNEEDEEENQGIESEPLSISSPPTHQPYRFSPDTHQKILMSNFMLATPKLNIPNQQQQQQQSIMSPLMPQIKPAMNPVYPQDYQKPRQNPWILNTSPVQPNHSLYMYPPPQFAEFNDQRYMPPVSPNMIHLADLSEREHRKYSPQNRPIGHLNNGGSLNFEAIENFDGHGIRQVQIASRPDMRHLNYSVAEENEEYTDHFSSAHQSIDNSAANEIYGRGNLKSDEESKEIISVYSNSEDIDGLDDEIQSENRANANSTESVPFQNETSSFVDNIRLSDIHFGKKIGDGSFGEVYEAILWSQPVAVKIMRIKSDDIKKVESQIKKFQKEVSIMKTLRHPNIVEYMGISFPETKINHDSLNISFPRLCIVTELLPNGNLEQLLARRRLSWKRYFRFARDIASGLNWLHHKGIIHRDVKPSNLLVTSSYHIKIADFGLSHMKNNPTKGAGVYSVCGTRCYIAPEVLQKKPYDTKADVFSYGVVLCEMITGTYPFETLESRETHSLNEMVVSGIRPHIPDECFPGLRGLLESCWQDDPVMRPSMDEILDSLDDLEKEAIAASQTILEEELDDLPEEVRNVIQEERLRLSEIQSELNSLRSRCESMQVQLGIARRNLESETTDKKKIEKRVKAVSQQRDKWKQQFESLKRQVSSMEQDGKIVSAGRKSNNSGSPISKKRNRTDDQTASIPKNDK